MLQSKRKIFLSTPIEDVCDRMDVRRKIKFDSLPWELFQEKVGDALSHPNPEIRRQAESVAMKCGGLPLALITVGRAMASKRTTKECKHAITVLKIAPWQLLGMEKDLLVPGEIGRIDLAMSTFPHNLAFCYAILYLF